MPTDESPNKNSTAPTAPTNLHVVNLYATSLTLAWDAASDASSYEVWITDSAQTGAQPLKTPVTAPTYTAANLLPNHPYRIQVYSVVTVNGTRVLSSTAAEKSTTTDYIVIEDTLDCPPPNELGSICPLSCGGATVESPDIVRWSTFSGRDFHKIRIKAKGSSTVLVQAVLERTMPGGTLHVRNMANLICDNTQLAVNPPSSAGCPSGVPPLSFCGTFPHNGSTVSYRIEADIDKCVVRLLSPADPDKYEIEAERCTPPSQQ